MTMQVALLLLLLIILGEPVTLVVVALASLALLQRAGYTVVRVEVGSSSQELTSLLLLLLLSLLLIASLSKSAVDGEIELTDLYVVVRWECDWELPIRRVRVLRRTRRSRLVVIRQLVASGA